MRGYVSSTTLSHTDRHSSGVYNEDPINTWPGPVDAYRGTAPGAAAVQLTAALDRSRAEACRINRLASAWRRDYVGP